MISADKSINLSLPLSHNAVNDTIAGSGWLGFEEIKEEKRG
jgi:hypothetical protein